MNNYPERVENFREDELRSMIDSDESVDGATHPLIVTAALAVSLVFCPTASCTKKC